ncbi:c-type cytochrome biogenesis protein CcmI [Motiliproteus sp.]|uniref:c-type cytochrome biogenesis protein CcmI n=1 Tax=Motiliproteus sp. TaxID=1898955 RepID=UPI003BA9FE95
MMTLFWSMMAVLIVLTLVFIWWPWLRKADPQQQLSAVDRNQLNIEIFKQRLAELEKELAQGNLDQTAFDELKLELEQNLLQEVDEPEAQQQTAVASRGPIWLPVGLSVLVPVLSIVMYLKWGASDKLAIPAAPVVQQGEEQQGHDPQSLEEQVEMLRERMQASPDNPEGWFILARTYMTLENYKEAAWAYGRLTDLIGEQAEILSQQAQALYFVNDHRVTDEVQQLLDKALELNPEDPGALGLQGIAAYTQGDFIAAIEYWTQLIETDPESPSRNGVVDMIEQAKANLAQQGVVYEPKIPAAPSAAPSETDPAMAALIPVRVELAPELANGLAADTTVFVFAQPVDGPKMPLAAARLKLSDLPAELILDDSMAMTPMAKLSAHQQVQLRASVSRSGDVNLQPGDLRGQVTPVAVSGHQQPVTVLIDQVVQ